MLRGDKITGKAMRGRDVHAIDHCMNKRVCPLRRKLSILTRGAYGCRVDDVLAQRLGNRISTTVRRQFFEYIVPVKPNGACADTKYHTDFFVGLAFLAPG